jgi:hypothetical protein
MAQVSNAQIDDLYRAKYQANDRQWLQAEAKRDPQQFLDVAKRIGVQPPSSAPGAPPVQPANAFEKAMTANAGAVPPPLALPPAPVAPPPMVPAPLPMPLPPAAGPPPVILGPNGMPLPPSGAPIPAMAGGGVVTQPTLALIGEAGPEAVVPLTQPMPPLRAADAADRGQPTPDEINMYIADAAAKRGIDPGTALAVAYHEGTATGQPNQRGTFPTGSSWWPFQLHYGGAGYEQFGTVAGLGNDFTAQTGYQPGDPRAWQAATDFALDTVLQRGWYPTFYGSVPAKVAPTQGLPPTAPVMARRG